MNHILIEEDLGLEVKPGMKVLDFSNELYEVISYKSDRVRVRKIGSTASQEFYPSAFALKIVKAQQ